MTTTRPLARPELLRGRCPQEAVLDGALLTQTSLLATLITAHSETTSGRSVNHAELMRLVKSQQSMLSACHDRARLNDAGKVFIPARKAD